MAGLRDPHKNYSANIKGLKTSASVKSKKVAVIYAGLLLCCIKIHSSVGAHYKSVPVEHISRRSCVLMTESPPNPVGDHSVYSWMITWMWSKKSMNCSHSRELQAKPWIVTLRPALWNENSTFPYILKSSQCIKSVAATQKKCLCIPILVRTHGSMRVGCPLMSTLVRQSYSIILTPPADYWVTSLVTRMSSRLWEMIWWVFNVTARTVFVFCGRARDVQRGSRKDASFEAIPGSLDPKILWGLQLSCWLHLSRCSSTIVSSYRETREWRGEQRFWHEMINSSQNMSRGICL